MDQKVISERGKVSKHKIFEAATLIVANRGIENASVTAISAGAGVSRGLLSYYLPQKKDLLLALIRYVLEEGWGRFPSIDVPRTHPGVPEEIEKRIRRNFLFFGKNTHYFRLFMLFFYQASYDPSCTELNTEIHDNVTGQFADVLQSSGFTIRNASELADRIYGMMFYEVQRQHTLRGRTGGSKTDPVELLLSHIERLIQSTG